MDDWILINEHSSHGIYTRASRSTGAVISGCFDVGIFFGTFESRGLVASSLLQPESCLNTVAIFFREAETTDLRQKYDPILLNQIARCSINPVVQLNSVSIKDVDNILSQILSCVPPEYFKAEADWFFDLGGAPITYFLGLMACLRDTFPSPRLTLFNPTGHYGSHKAKNSFTSGFEKMIWIPRLWGRPDPCLPKTYVFLLGFDSERGYEVFYRCEPDVMRAIIADPGYEEGYEHEPLKRNRILLEESGLFAVNGHQDIIKCDAGDPVAVWKELEELVSEQKGKSNVVFVPLGTKAHGLGCGLCALMDGIPAVLYHMPRIYSVRDTERGQWVWKYEVTL